MRAFAGLSRGDWDLRRDYQLGIAVLEPWALATQDAEDRQERDRLKAQKKAEKKAAKKATAALGKKGPEGLLDDKDALEAEDAWEAQQLAAATVPGVMRRGDEAGLGGNPGKKSNGTGSSLLHMDPFGKSKAKSKSKSSEDDSHSAAEADPGSAGTDKPQLCLSYRQWKRIRARLGLKIRDELAESGDHRSRGRVQRAETEMRNAVSGLVNLDGASNGGSPSSAAAWDLVARVQANARAIRAFAQRQLLSAPTALSLLETSSFAPARALLWKWLSGVHAKRQPHSKPFLQAVRDFYWSWRRSTRQVDGKTDPASGNHLFGPREAPRDPADDDSEDESDNEDGNGDGNGDGARQPAPTIIEDPRGIFDDASLRRFGKPLQLQFSYLLQLVECFVLDAAPASGSAAQTTGPKRHDKESESYFAAVLLGEDGFDAEAAGFALQAADGDADGKSPRSRSSASTWQSTLEQQSRDAQRQFAEWEKDSHRAHLQRSHDADHGIFASGAPPSNPSGFGSSSASSARGRAGQSYEDWELEHETPELGIKECLELAAADAGLDLRPRGGGSGGSVTSAGRKVWVLSSQSSAAKPKRRWLFWEQDVVYHCAGDQDFAADSQYEPDTIEGIVGSFG